MKSSKEFFIIILTKQGECYILTNIMPFIETYRHEGHHCSHLLAWAVIIVKNKSNRKQIWNNKSKDVNGDRLGGQDSLQSSHEPSVYSSRTSC